MDSFPFSFEFTKKGWGEGKTWVDNVSCCLHFFSFFLLFYSFAGISSSALLTILKIISLAPEGIQNPLLILVEITIHCHIIITSIILMSSKAVCNVYVYMFERWMYCIPIHCSYRSTNKKGSQIPFICFRLFLVQLNSMTRFDSKKLLSQPKQTTTASGTEKKQRKEENPIYWSFIWIFKKLLTNHFCTIFEGYKLIIRKLPKRKFFFFWITPKK